VSPPESAEAGRGVYVEKPKSNIFTVMLLMSLVAILVAIVFLCLEMAQYGWDRKAPRVAMRTIHSQHAVAFAFPPKHTGMHYGVSGQTAAGRGQFFAPARDCPLPSAYCPLLNLCLRGE
jgi:hypothetical protein